MGNHFSGTDLLESSGFLLRKAELANKGGVRIPRFQGIESHERGDGFILAFLGPQDTTLAIVRRRSFGSSLRTPFERSVGYLGYLRQIFGSHE